MNTTEQKDLNKKVSDNYINGNCSKCVNFSGFATHGGYCYLNKCSPKEVFNGKTNATN